MKEDLKKLSLEELLKNEKQMKVFITSFVGIGIVGLGAFLYLFFTTGEFNGGVITLLTLAAIVPTQVKNINAIQQEIDLRK
jgi:hypothetical protein